MRRGYRFLRIKPTLLPGLILWLQSHPKRALRSCRVRAPSYRRDIFEIPKKMEAQVRPRSGLAIKHGVTVLNSPGTIDADYRGEVSVILINHGNEPFVIARGERIAQMIVAPVTRVKLRETKKIAPTKRGKGGFGSTGIGETPSQASPEAGKSVASVSRKAKTKSSAKKR